MALLLRHQFYSHDVSLHDTVKNLDWDCLIIQPTNLLQYIDIFLLSPDYVKLPLIQFCAPIRAHFDMPVRLIEAVI